MSFWQFLGNIAVSDQGKTVQRMSENMSVSSDVTVYTQMGSFGTDGSAWLGSGATGIGAVFNFNNNNEG